MPGAAAAAGVLLLFGLALRPRAPCPPLRLRVTASLLLTTPMPALIATNCDPQPPPRILGTHGSAVLFYATDHLGSTVAVVDSQQQQVKMRRGYQPFGEVGWGEGYELGHQFTGERLDPTGLYALGPRQYDPTTGRFLQPDPIVPGAENPQTLNRYSYVLNRPLEFTDPSGLFPIPLFLPGFFFFAGFFDSIGSTASPGFSGSNGSTGGRPPGTEGCTGGNCDTPTRPTFDLLAPGSLSGLTQIEVRSTDFAEAPSPPQIRLQELLVEPILEILPGRERTFEEELDHLRKRERRTRASIERLDVTMFLPLIRPRALEPRSMAIRAVLTALTLRRRELLVESLEFTRSRINTLEHGAGRDLTEFPPIPSSPLKP